MNLSHYENNFDFLRFFAASCVIISHSFAVIGLAEPKLICGQTLGFIGVAIFFIISGFLITKSWDQDRNVKSFIWKRILRILPGLIFASVLVTLIIGPIVTEFNLFDYFFNLQTYRYFFFAIFFPAWDLVPFDNLPGVFATNPMAFIVNGPLWTLVYEESMYILVMIFGTIGILYKKIVMVPLFAFTFFLLLILNRGYLSWLNFLIWGMIFFCLFFVASQLYLNNKNRTFSINIFLISAGLLIGSAFTQYFTFFAVFTLPYVILFIANKKILYLHKFGKYGDYSFGMYIFAWPIQQMIAMSLPGINVAYTIILSFLFTFPFAYISWHFIESKALIRKKKIPQFLLQLSK